MSGIMLSVIIMSVISLSGVLLSVIMLSFVMLSVILLCYAECNYADCRYAGCRGIPGEVVYAGPHHSLSFYRRINWKIMVSTYFTDNIWLNVQWIIGHAIFVSQSQEQRVILSTGISSFIE
jgi:hypothetical protein